MKADFIWACAQSEAIGATSLYLLEGKRSRAWQTRDELRDREAKGYSW
jgi:hypothetical protein